MTMTNSSNRQLTVRWSMLLCLLVAAALSLPQLASAETGKRVCLDDSRQYVIKVNSDNTNLCTEGDDVIFEMDGDAQSVTWSNPKIMECGDFSRIYTKWEWDSCYDMDTVWPEGYNCTWTDGSYYSPGSRTCEGKKMDTRGKLHQVAMVPREEDIKSGVACGADTCGMSLTWLDIDDFGFNAGASLTLAEIYGVDIGFSASTSEGTGGSVSCSWKKGVTPGIYLNRQVSSFHSTNPADLVAALGCKTKGIADEDLQREEEYLRCWGNFGAKNVNTGAILTVNSDGGRYTGNYPGTDEPVTYNTAKGYFEADKTQFENPEGRPLWPYTSYSFQPSGYPHLVRCGMEMLIATPPDLWRGANELVEWNVIYRYEFARES